MAFLPCFLLYQAPAKCVEHSKNYKRQPQLVVDVCTGASSVAPARCLDLLPRAVSHEAAASLCSRVQTEGPAHCTNARGQLSHGLELTARLCQGADSQGPADCFRRSTLGFKLSTDDRVELCSGAQTDAPARCNQRFVLPDHAVEIISPTDTLFINVCCRDRHTSWSTAVLLQVIFPESCNMWLLNSKTATFVELTRNGCNGVHILTGYPIQSGYADTPLFPLHAISRCAGNIRDRRLEPSERVALCRGASSTAPAVCLASLPPSLPSESRVALCQGAEESNPTAAALCFKAVPQNLPSTIATALCRGASDSMGAECAKVARHTVGDTDDIAKLCRGASSRAPAHCAKKAFRAGVEKHLAAMLCSGSTSLAPALCFLAAPAQIPAEVRVTACAGTHSTSPGHCMIAAMPRGLQAPTSGAVCSLDQEAGSFPRRRLEYRLAGRLCRDASDNSPAECARSAPSGLSDGEVELLCAAKNIPQGEAIAKCAAAALAFGFSSRNAASLCRGAGSDAPAACAAMVAPRIGEDGRLAVCTGASSNAPARCANSVSVARALSAVDVSECKSAIPQPSGLHITNLGHEGDVLFVDQPMRATLEVRDQWGGSISSDSSTVVRASVALRGSGGASVNAVGRFNTSSEGLVHFSHLSFSGAGSLTLQFSIDGGDGGNTPLAAALVIVAETEHGVVARRCGRIFRQLACPPEADAERADEGMVKHHEPIRTEAVSIVSGGTTAAWQVLTCQRTLEENGVHVAYFPWGTSSFNAWLWYHPGIEALETGAGLPSRNQPAWETLGVERGAHARELRRAYYRQSLLWHPDRWVRHAMHSARAEEVFEIVSEAYAWMVNERSNGRRD